MKIAIGSDHAGLNLKNQIIEYLKDKNIEVIDEGTYGPESVDYPDFAVKVCNDYVTGCVDYGILVCYTGIGMSMAANKVKGVRAALVGIVEDAILTKEHNNANLIIFGSRTMTVDEVRKRIDIFLNSKFLGDRYAVRNAKLDD